MSTHLLTLFVTCLNRPNKKHARITIFLISGGSFYETNFQNNKLICILFPWSACSADPTNIKHNNNMKKERKTNKKKTKQKLTQTK